MQRTHEEQLATFTEEDMPNLDVVVLGALERFSHEHLPSLSVFPEEGTLVLGSVNAAAVGRLLFPHALGYADESTYTEVISTHAEHAERAVIVSASGGKHAVSMAAALKDAGCETWLLTNNAEAPAAAYLEPGRVLVFPKNREPYTYNTSTYLGMLLARTKEDPEAVHSFIEREVAPILPENLGTWSAYCLIVPARFSGLVPMLRTKFDELFGARVCGRVFTEEEIKHAKTVVPTEGELFVSLGVENASFGSKQARLHLPLPEGAEDGAMMAIGYYLIGRIQAAHPPYFREHIGEYARTASELFGQRIEPIVE